MTYFVQGMPDDLQRADIEYTDLMRRVRNNPTRLVSYLGLALKYAKQYFEADRTKGKLFTSLSMHFGRCETCRTAGWEKCEAMNGWLTEGKELS